MAGMILIPNATSPKNLGDQAILVGLLEIIKKKYPKEKIIVHSSDPEYHPKNLGYEARQSVLDWLLFEKESFLGRLGQLIETIFSLLKASINKQPRKQFYRDYFEADKIIFVGNGGLRTKKGLTQSVYLFGQLLSHVWAKLSGKKFIFAPISFGPFAYDWQAKLTAVTLNWANTTYTREKISFDMAKKFGVKNLLLTNDTAFLIPKVNNKKYKNLTIGLSLRPWFSKHGQILFENEVIESITNFALKHKATILPIVQVHAPEHHEDDYKCLQRVCAELKKNRVIVRDPFVPTRLMDVQKVYGSLDLLVGMRMHANILALVQGVPVVAIGYEHKTRGIMKSMGMEKYAVEAKELTAKKLYELLVIVYKQQSKIRKTINDEVAKARRMLIDLV